MSKSCQILLLRKLLILLYSIIEIRVLSYKTAILVLFQNAFRC